MPRIKRYDAALGKWVYADEAGKGEDGKSAYQYAQDGGYTGSEAEFAKKLAKEFPTKLSSFDNDEGFITDADVPVKSVNGKTGAVTLDASAVGARADTWTPSYSDVGADKSGTASSTVSAHNTNTSAHNDIRLLVEGLTTRLNALANSTDEDLDQMAEIVAYIQSNKSLIDGITTSKVNVADIVNNLTTNVTNKPLSAAQGVALKALVDALDDEKLDITELSAAINTALAQAKASGEFDGETGQRGTGLLPVTTAPSSYTTETGGITPKYRMDISTIKTQAGVTEVLLGDTVRYSYYHYPIAYLDASYAYFTTRVSIRGATGAAYTLTDADKTAIVNAVKASLTTETWTFTLADGTTVTKAVLLG